MLLLTSIFLAIFICTAVVLHLITYSFFSDNNDYWNSIYKNAVKNKNFFSLAYRIESLEISIKYQESIFNKYEEKINQVTSHLKQYSGLSVLKSLKTQSNEENIQYNKILKDELENILYNTTKASLPFKQNHSNNYVTFHCGDHKNYIRIGQNDFSSSVENECHTFISSMEYSTSSSSNINFSPNYIFKIEFVENWEEFLKNSDNYRAIKIKNLLEKYRNTDYKNLSYTENNLIPYNIPFLIRSMSNNRYVRVVSPPKDSVYAPFLFESSGLTPYISDFFILDKTTDSLRSIIYPDSPIKCMPPNDLFHSTANKMEQILSKEDKDSTNEFYNEEISNSLTQELVYHNSFEAMFGGDGNLLKGFIDSTVGSKFYFEPVSRENLNHAQKLLAISNIILKKQNSHLYDHKLQREKEHKDEELELQSKFKNLYSKYFQGVYGPSNFVDITGRESIPVAILVTLSQFSLNSITLDSHVLFEKLLPSLINTLNFNTNKFKIKIFIGVEASSIDFNRNDNVTNNISTKKNIQKLTYEDIFSTVKNDKGDIVSLSEYKIELLKTFYNKIINFIKDHYMSQDNNLSNGLKKMIDNDNFSITCIPIDHNISEEPSLSSSFLYFNSIYSANALSNIAANENFEYFVHVTDQTEFRTGNWLHSSINKLFHSSILPNFGIVGPKDEVTGSNIMIPLVHRTHLQIFNGFYPISLNHASRDYGIEWINLVYGEEFRVKLNDFITKCPSDQLSNSQSQLFMTLFTNFSQKIKLKLIREQHDLQETIKLEVLKGHSEINKWLKDNNLPRLSLPHVCGYIPSVIHLEKLLN